MKLTVQKIILSFFAIAVSVAAAVIGMYMVFLANMVFTYRLLFAAIFMFNPILTVFLIVFMFKKPEPKEPKEAKGKKKRKDSEEEYAPETSYQTPEPPAYVPPAEPVSPVTPQSSFMEPAEPSHNPTASSGYDLPGSETFTGYSETTNASDVTAAESSASTVKNKLKFWSKSDSDKEGI